MYLDCRYVPTPHSIIQGVLKLPPGNYMVMDLKKHSLELKEYWNLEEVRLQTISYDSAKEELHSLLKDAVRIRLQSEINWFV